MSSANVGKTGGTHDPVVHVGAPSPNTQDEWVKTNVYFHGFADLPTATEKVQSPLFYCFGLKWCLVLYPRGKKISTTYEEGTTSLYLRLSSNARINIEYGFAINDFVNARRARRTKNFTYNFTQNTTRGYKRFVLRETALTYLANGALVIEVRMKPFHDANPFVPENPSKHLTIKDFFMDEKSADVVFEIGGYEQVTRRAKRRRTPSTKMYAHSLILRKAAPQLAELCKSGESPALIEIQDTSIDAFRDMLLYIYGCNIPNFGNDALRTKEIIEVADKYGVITLKLEAEAIYVSSLTLTLENVMEYFMFAEAKNCAYLKEKVLDFIVDNKAEIMKQKILSSAIGGPSSSDILAAVAMSETKHKDGNNLRAKSISELRRKAYTKGIDVDGSREALISALENSTK